MKSEDENFDEVVESKGGKIVYPSFWTDPICPMEVMKQFGDCHPNVESPLKHTGSHPHTKIPFAFSPPKTTLVFFESYYICWYIMPTTHVVTVNGYLLMGTDDIIANQDQLPDSLKLIHLPTPERNVQ